MTLRSRHLQLIFLVSFAWANLVTAAQPIDKANCGVAKGESLAVIVGRRIDLRPAGEVPSAIDVVMDERFVARYQILQVVCGNLAGTEVEFDVYDHYGTPAFARFDTVLLYLSRHKGRLVHEKYQYHDVYETADGAWAGCGDPYKFEPKVHRHGLVVARPVSFKREVTFSVAGVPEPQAAKMYPAEHFTRRGSLAVCQAGTPLEGLFAIKRDGVLKARGLFK